MKNIVIALLIAAGSAALANTEGDAFDLDAVEYVPAVSLNTVYPGPVMLPLPAYEVRDPCESDSCYFLPDATLEVAYWQVAQAMAAHEFRLVAEASPQGQLWAPTSRVLSGSIGLFF